ncbi:hypothetical protein LWI28_018866 [Acer negundo]|uniref:Uncharacterized protein n=1 Tax=Acer negundo TaxID=4023 RepID=A0AAD5IEV9_ACENE|nr:hypothetical protein LWI28_018866 [Acer negundo]
MVTVVEDQIPVDVEWVEQFPGLVKFPTHLKDQLEYASIEEELLEVDKGRVRWDSNQDKAWCQAKRRSLEKNIHKKGNLSHGNEKFDFVRIGLVLVRFRRFGSSSSDDSALVPIRFSTIQFGSDGLVSVPVPTIL